MEVTDQTQGPVGTEGAEAQVQAPSVTDIDSLQEFTFQGEKYTPERFHKLVSEYKSLSESRAEQTKYKDYVENVHIDIEKVLKDPSLADAFRKVYPEQFHVVLDRALGINRQGASTEQSQNTMPKEIQDKIANLESKLSDYDRKAYEAEVAKHEAYLQKTVDPLFEKYPYANQDAVYAKAEALIAKGYRMNDTAWERLIKENRIAIEKRAEDLHQKKLKAQIEKGTRAKDTGPGGTQPGQAPPRARTFAEATEAMIQNLRKAP